MSEFLREWYPSRVPVGDLSSVSILPDVDPIAEKAKEVAKAAAEKEARLKEIDKDAWMQREEADTLWGQTKNLAANILGSGGRALGTGLKAVGNLPKTFIEGAIEPESYKYEDLEKQLNARITSLNSQINKTTDPVQNRALLAEFNALREKQTEITKWLDSPINPEETSGIMGRLAPALSSTPITRRRALEARREASDGFLDQYGEAVIERSQAIVNQEYNQSAEEFADAYGKQAADVWRQGNVVTGSVGWFAKQMEGVYENITTNPGASLALFSNNLLEMLATKNPVAATAVYAPRILDFKEKAYEDFIKEHGGRAPNAKEQALIDVLGTTAVASDFILDKAILKSVPVLNKLFKENPDLLSDTMKKELVTKYPKLRGALKQVGILGAAPSGEMLQGTFQAGSEDFAGKQDLTKLNTAEISKQGILEGTAMGPISAMKAAEVPGAISQAGAKNEAVKQATTASEAFKQTQTYQDLPQAVGTPVEAYRGFEKAPTAESFTNAVSALVANPHHNAPEIAKRIIGIAGQANIEINPEIKTYLDQVSTPTQGAVLKGYKAVAGKINETVDAVGSIARDKTLSDEAIKSNPDVAMNSLIRQVGPKLDEIQTIEELTEYENTFLKPMAGRIIQAFKDSGKGPLEVTREDGTKVKVDHPDLDKFKKDYFNMYEATLARVNKVNDPETIKTITTATTQARATDAKLASSIDAVLGSMKVSSDARLFTEPQLDALIESEALTSEEKDYVKQYKEVIKDIDVVSKDLTQGGDGFKGNREYFQDIESAIAFGDKEEARKAVDTFRNWVNKYTGNRQQVIDAFEGGNFNARIPKLAKGKDGETLYWDIKEYSGKNFIPALKGDIETMQSAGLFAELQYNKAFGDKQGDKQAEVKEEGNTENKLESFVNHSGGAIGSDSAWDTIGKEFGMISNNHYYIDSVGAVGGNKVAIKTKPPKGNVPLTKEEVREGQVKATKAARQMGRIESNHIVRNSLIIRNWMQVKNSDAVFAITTLTKKGESLEHGKTALIDQGAGGTGYAIQMAINENKPVYLFDQTQEKWFTYKEGNWIEISTPNLTPKFAGIGTRNINDAGKVAIRSVYQTAIEASQKPSEPVKPTQATQSTTEATEAATEASGLREKANKLYTDLTELGIVIRRTVESVTDSQLVGYIANLENKLTEAIATKEKFSLNNQVKELITRLKNIVPNITGVDKGIIDKSVKLLNKDNPLGFTFKDSMFENIEEINKKLSEISPEIKSAVDALTNSIIGSTNTLVKLPEQDPTVFLMTGTFGNDPKGTITFPQKIAKAMAIVGYVYMGTQGRGLMGNSQEAIKMLLGYDSRERLPDVAWKLADYGKNVNGLADTLGRDVFKLLGLKRNKGTDNIQQKRLEHALGFWVIKGLLADKYVVQQAMPLEEYRELLREGVEDTENKDDGVNVNFIKATVNEINDDVELAGKAKAAYELFKNTEGLSNKILDAFPISIKEIKPITKPIKFIRDTIKNSSQKLTNRAKKVIEKLQSRSFEFNQDAYDLFYGLLDSNEDFVLDKLGYARDIDGGHIFFKKGREAKNRAIKRTLANIKEFKEKVGSNKFYLPFFITTANRVFLDGYTGINPQGDKTSRHLTHLSENTVFIDPKNKKQVYNFKLVAISAFGFEVGKHYEKEGIVKYDKFIEYLNSIGLTLANVKERPDLIIQALSNENFEVEELSHGIQNLYGILRYEAFKNQSVPIKVNVSIEIDGKNNGPSWGISQTLGIATTLPNKRKSLFVSLGILTDPNDKEFLDAKGDGDDTYQAIARIWGQNLNEAKNKVSAVVRSAISAQEFFLGNLTESKEGKEIVSKFGRDLTKHPLMKTVYGQGEDTLRSDLVKVLEEKIYTELEKADTQERIDILVEQIKNLHPNPKFKNSINITLENKNSFVFTKQQYRDGLMSGGASIYNTYGNALVAAIGTNFNAFIEIRKSVNKVMVHNAELFIEAYTKAVDDYLKDKDIKQVTDEEIENLIYNTDLYKLLPSYNIPNMDSDEKNDLRKGYLGLKIRVVRNPDVDVQTSYTKNSIKLENGSFTSSHSGGILKIEFTDPGVAGLITMIHTMDGSEMQRILDMHNVFGVHDAVILNPDQMDSVGHSLNKEFATLNQEFSILESVLNTYARIEEEARKQGIFLSQDEESLKKLDQVNKSIPMLNIALRNKKSFWENDPITIVEFPKEGAGYSINMSSDITDEGVDTPPWDTEVTGETPTETLTETTPPWDEEVTAEEESVINNEVNDISNNANNNSADASILGMRLGANTWQYTNQQREVLLSLSEKLKGFSGNYLVNGSAGTGKTTIVENIINYAKELGKEVFVVAPTNKAVSVINSKLTMLKGKYKHSTLHKLLLGAPVTDEKTGEIIEWNEKAPTFESGKQYVLIIDEASMMNLELVNNYLRQSSNGNVIAIFLGDQNQLKPINDDPKLFSIDSSVIRFNERYSFTEVRRQSLESNILKVATALATSGATINYVLTDTNLEDFKVVNKAELEQLALNAITKDPVNNVYLTFTNEDRVAFNSKVRNKLNYKKSLVPGESIITISNNGNYFNGNVSSVKETITELIPEESIETIHYTIKKNNKFIDMEGKVAVYKSGEEILMVLPDLKDASLKPNFISEYAAKVVGTSVFNVLFTKSDKGVVLNKNVNIVTYAYALTTHKSQGSQWKNVFFNHASDGTDSNSVHLYYTAITRASDKVTIAYTGKGTTGPKKNIQELTDIANNVIVPDTEQNKESNIVEEYTPATQPMPDNAISMEYLTEFFAGSVVNEINNAEIEQYFGQIAPEDLDNVLRCKK